MSNTILAGHDLATSRRENVYLNDNRLLTYDEDVSKSVKELSDNFLNQGLTASDTTTHTKLDTINDTLSNSTINVNTGLSNLATTDNQSIINNSIQSVKDTLSNTTLSVDTGITDVATSINQLNINSNIRAIQDRKLYGEDYGQPSNNQVLRVDENGKMSSKLYGYSYTLGQDIQLQLNDTNKLLTIDNDAIQSINDINTTLTNNTISVDTGLSNLATTDNQSVINNSIQSVKDTLSNTTLSVDTGLTGLATSVNQDYINSNIKVINDTLSNTTLNVDTGLTGLATSVNQDYINSNIKVINDTLTSNTISVNDTNTQSNINTLISNFKYDNLQEWLATEEFNTVKIAGFDIQHNKYHNLSVEQDGKLKTIVETNGSTLSTSDSNTHIKLDSLITNTPKTLRQLRGEGKCYSVYGQAWDINNTTGETTICALRNPETNTKTVYVYQITGAISKATSTDERLDVVVRRINGFSSLTGGVVGYKTNLNFGFSNTSNVEFRQKKDSTDISTTKTTVDFLDNITLSASGTTTTIDFQEAFIEIPPGTGLIFRGNHQGPITSTIGLRYVETDENL